MKKIVLSLSALLLIACTAESNGLSRAEVEKIVAEYIANNGGAIAASLDTHMTNQKAELAANIVRENNLVLQNEKAEVTLVEFGNFRCPYCHRAQETMAQVHAKYPNNVKHVFKHMPIDPTSYQGALALQAATELGKGKEFFDRMWDETELTDEVFVRVAESIGLDIAKFNDIRTSEAVQAQIEQDVADAHALGGQGTPFFIVAGEPLSGAQPLDQFALILDKALEK